MMPEYPYVCHAEKCNWKGHLEHSMAETKTTKNCPECNAELTRTFDVPHLNTFFYDPTKEHNANIEAQIAGFDQDTEGDAL